MKEEHYDYQQQSEEDQQQQEIDIKNFSVPKGYRLVPIVVVFADKDYYWKKFEELLPDLLENFPVEGIFEAIDTEIEVRKEKEDEMQERVKGLKPEDFGVPRGS